MGSYIFVHYHAFVSCIYFRYLVQIIDFLLIELPIILFAVWREAKQTRKYQVDYLVKKNPPSLALACWRNTALCLCICRLIVCICQRVQFRLNSQNKPFSCTTTCEYVWRISMIGSWRNILFCYFP